METPGAEAASAVELNGNCLRPLSGTRPLTDVFWWHCRKLGDKTYFWSSWRLDFLVSSHLRPRRRGVARNSQCWLESSRRRRRGFDAEDVATRQRDAEGVEGDREWGEDLEERRKLLKRGPGRSPGRNWILYSLDAKEATWLHVLHWIFTESNVVTSKLHLGLRVRLSDEKAIARKYFSHGLITA